MPMLPYDERHCRALERIADAIEGLLEHANVKNVDHSAYPDWSTVGTLAQSAQGAGIKIKMAPPPLVATNGKKKAHAAGKK